MRKSTVRKNRRGLRKQRSTFRRGRLGGSSVSTVGPVVPATAATGPTAPTAANAANPGMVINATDKSPLTSEKMGPLVSTNPGLVTNAPIVPAYGPAAASGPAAAAGPAAGPAAVNSVYKPTANQFGFNKKGPEPLSLTGDFTKYEMGIPGVIGMQGYTKPGENPLMPGALQHTGLSGYGQTAQLVAGLAMPGPKSTTTVNINQAPLDYYGVLGLMNKRTPIPKSELNAAYEKRKNTGTNSEKQILKTAYNTLSDPAKRYKYDQFVSEYFTAHPPSLSDLMTLASKSGMKGPGGVPINTGFKMLSSIPGFGVATSRPMTNMRG